LASRWDPPFWIGDRLFTREDLDLIYWTAERFSALSRTELAFTICENLPWKAPNGQLRLHGCLALLEQLTTAGIIQIPEKRDLAAYQPARLQAEPLAETEIAASLDELRPVTVEPVPPEEQAVWDATVAQHHPLGFQRAFGAHQRYWIRGNVAGRRVVVGALLFAAAARNVAVRDAWLGWTRHQQQHFRQRVVANSRYLILPGVDVPHLASHALALALRRLPEDWRARYGYAPVVVETFVTPPWRGTCYRAANWVHLGQTTGRGRQDRNYDQAGTIREVFVYPLVRNWRRALVAQAPTPESAGATAKPRTGRRAKRSAAAHGGDDGMITAEQQLKAMTEERIKQRYESLAPFLDERQRRLLAGAEALAYGTGGQKRVAALLGMSESTVSRGVRELRNPETIETERVRQLGGGRKPTTDSDPELLSDLERLISPETRGDPQSPLRWTCKSTRKLAAELKAMKPERSVSQYLVRDLLHKMGYSLQAVRKTREGSEHPDRDVQFQHINATVAKYQKRCQPVISVDTKKKELVGDFKNAGREWQPKGKPETARVHDFVIPELGKVNPYGVYDPIRNEGWVNVGIDHDTAAFAVASIRGWWQSMGQPAYPDATKLLITADGGGSNSSRSRLWKVELQKLADETGLNIAVCHFPPGTSKWNKVEHRLFSHITQNWRGRSLESHEVIVNLIANTTTEAGLTVRAQLDENIYPTGVKVSDEELKAVEIKRSDFHGDWNYVICPRNRP
jgi:transposase